MTNERLARLLEDIGNAPGYVLDNVECYFYHNTTNCTGCPRRETCPDREPRKINVSKK